VLQVIEEWKRFETAKYRKWRAFSWKSNKNTRRKVYMIGWHGRYAIIAIITGWRLIQKQIASACEWRLLGLQPNTPIFEH